MRNLDIIDIGFGIRKRTILYMLMIFPFFEPMLFGLLEENGIHAELWAAIGNIYLLLRIAIVAFLTARFLILLVNNRPHFGKAAVFLIINIFMWGVSSLFNHAGGVRLWVNVAQNIGFVLLCVILADESEEDFLRANILLFCVLSAAGMLSVFIHPMGYLNAERTNDAFYFLGGKNGSFPYYYCFLFCTVLYSLVWKKKKPKITGWIVLMLLAALVCRSSNSLLCLLLVLLCVLLINALPSLVRKCNPKVIAGIMVVVLALIYTGNVNRLLISVLGRFGRDATFSGRDVVWKQAFGYIADNPLWGVGTTAQFILRDLRDAGHAHSQYLHRLAVYGIVPFVFFLMSVIAVFRKGNSIKRNKYKPAVYITEMLMLVYLLHMAFDTYPYYFPILIIVTAERALMKIDSGPAESDRRLTWLSDEPVKTAFIDKMIS